MEFHKFVTIFLFALVFARVELSLSLAVKGSLKCLDCHSQYDFSDIKVQVECIGVKKLATTTTSKDGSFELDLPKYPRTNCKAKILGASTQIYTSKSTMFSKIRKNSDTKSYTVDPTLKFYTSCPLPKSSPLCRARGSSLGSSLTVDLPIPPEWGLAPSSYYVPYFPIIGIP